MRPLTTIARTVENLPASPGRALARQPAGVVAARWRGATGAGSGGEAEERNGHGQKHDEFAHCVVVLCFLSGKLLLLKSIRIPGRRVSECKKVP